MIEKIFSLCMGKIKSTILDFGWQMHPDLHRRGVTVLSGKRT